MEIGYNDNTKQLDPAGHRTRDLKVSDTMKVGVRKPLDYGGRVFKDILLTDYTELIRKQLYKMSDTVTR